jgi:type II restriction enzyme
VRKFTVTDLLLIPKFCIPASAIEKRNPLKPTARRAGWVGCNILLDFVPPQGRILMIDSGRIVPKADVRKDFQTIKLLENISAKSRGWTLDVLNFLRSLNKLEFTIDDAYSFENILSKLHPDNLHIKPKIRQQLQILRDMGYLQFVKPGYYIWLKG